MPATDSDPLLGARPWQVGILGNSTAPGRSAVRRFADSSMRDESLVVPIWKIKGTTWSEDANGGVRAGHGEVRCAPHVGSRKPPDGEFRLQQQQKSHEQYRKFIESPSSKDRKDTGLERLISRGREVIKCYRCSPRSFLSVRSGIDFFFESG